MRPKNTPTRRRGTLYLAVLGTALMVSIVGLTAMRLAREGLRDAVADGDVTRARLAAEAGVAYALERIERAGDRWRRDYESGVEEPGDDWLPLDDQSGFRFALTAYGRDGARVELDAAAASRFVVRGIGRAGGATSVAEAALIGDGPPLGCLDASLACEGELRLGPGGPASFGDDLTVDHPAFAGGDIERDFVQSGINGDAIAVGEINASVTGSAIENAAPRSFPGAGALDYYLQRGTWIDAAALPTSGGARSITGQVLSPRRNPFGPVTNPEGIYVIDCQGERLVVRNSRIVGTLVLLDNADDSGVEGLVNWAPAAANYPSLLTEKGFTLGFNGFFPLSESLLNINYNPDGAPHNGEEDDELDDVYPSEINGLIYVGGRLLVAGAGVPRVNGVVVCGAAFLDQDLTINYRDTAFQSPPPGFREPSADLQLMIGGWRRGAR